MCVPFNDLTTMSFDRYNCVARESVLFLDDALLVIAVVLYGDASVSEIVLVTPEHSRNSDARLGSSSAIRRKQEVSLSYVPGRREEAQLA